MKLQWSTSLEHNLGPNHCKRHHVYAKEAILCKTAQWVPLQRIPPPPPPRGTCSGWGLICISSKVTHHQAALLCLWMCYVSQNNGNWFHDYTGWISQSAARLWSLLWPFLQCSYFPMHIILCLFRMMLILFWNTEQNLCNVWYRLTISLIFADSIHLLLIWIVHKNWTSIFFFQI